MEIHTHSHTARKKWTHYLWEFLMLFLAVFCGFLAENQREHMIEHTREIQYMRSLKEDVGADIKQIDRLEIELQNFISRLDWIADDLNQSFGRSSSLITFKKISMGFGFSDFIYTDRTMQQLKNAGGMRLIRNLKVADSIVEYDAMVRRGLVHQDLINTQYLTRIVDKVDYAFNTTELDKLANVDYAKVDTNNLKRSILLTHDKTELIRLINEFRHFRFVIDIQLKYITEYRILAIRLCSFINKEYHLE